MKTKTACLTGLACLPFMIALIPTTVSLNSAPRTATRGTLVVTLKTASYGGKFAEKNIGAIWITDAQDRFVKTLELWADKRKRHLVKWNAASQGNVVDAVTGATSRMHVTHTAKWNCTDVNGATVADGVYRVYVEFTEDNSSSGAPPGKWFVAEFTKGPSNQTVTPPDQPYFKGIRLTYTADGGSPAPASLAGSVRDSANDQPLAGVNVNLRGAGGSAYSATSAAGGGFAFEEVAPGSYTLQATLTGYAAYNETVNLQAGQAITDKVIRMQKIAATASLSGQIIDAVSGQGISATVRLEKNGAVVYQRDASAQGEFSFDDVQPDTYIFRALKSGYSPFAEEITLSPSQQITGKVVPLSRQSAADTTAPAPPQQVRAYAAGNRP